MKIKESLLQTKKENKKKGGRKKNQKAFVDVTNDVISPLQLVANPLSRCCTVLSGLNEVHEWCAVEWDVLFVM